MQSEKNLYQVAIHEAGHAVMDVINKKIVKHVTIIPNGTILGECCSDFNDDIKENTSKQELDIKVAVECMGLLSGATAENVILGIAPELCSKRAQMDFNKALELVCNMFDNQKAKDNHITVVARNVFNTFITPLVKRQTIAVANELMKSKTLTGEQVIQVIGSVES